MSTATKARRVWKLRKSLTIGFIVTVYDADLPRAFWKLGRVENLMTGAYGRVRAAHVRIRSGNKQSSIIRSPIQRLYRFEASVVKNCLKDATLLPSEGTPSVQTKTLPQRLAAARAKERCLDQETIID